MASSSKGPAEWGIIGPWTRMHRLGKGGFGSVYLGKRQSDGKLFAVKSTYFVPRGGASKDPMEEVKQRIGEEYSLSSLINEIRTLKKLKSPYIVRYLGCGTSNGPSEMDGRLVLDCYLEYLPRGSLGHGLWGPLQEPFLKAYTKDILRGVRYLHFNKLVHGDLKTVNILMDTTNCKLADFGSVKDVRTSFFKKILFGTRGYKAPEVESNKEQTYASDIYSVGCTVQTLATAERPEPFNPLGSTTNKGGYTTRRAARDNSRQRFSDSLKDFLSKCLAVNPGDRWSAADLLKHPFVTEPVSPRWWPYDIPLPPDLETDTIDAIHQGPIVAPMDLDSGLPSAPFSPIHVVPMKKRKIQLKNEANVDDPETEEPEIGDRRRPLNMPSYLDDLISDNSSAMQVDQYGTNCKPTCKPDFHLRPARSPGRGNETPGERQPRGPKGRAAKAAVKKLSLRPQQTLAEYYTRNSKKKTEVASSVYQGQQIEFPDGVAMLDVDDSDEDKSPLVVHICSEFGIPLPPEYQKWVVHPSIRGTTVQPVSQSDQRTNHVMTRMKKQAVGMGCTVS